MLSAGTAQLRAASRAETEALIGSIDWRHLAGRLRDQSLLPLLGGRIIDVAGQIAPDWFRSEVDRERERSAAREAALELICIQIMDALARGGVRSVPLKGPLLGGALYGTPGNRASLDIDLLVAPEELDQAAVIAARFGYLPPPRRSARLPLLHDRLYHVDPGVPPLELHWRVHWYETDFSRDLLAGSRRSAELWERPQALDEFISLLLFYARDGFIGLRLLCDLAAWWDNLGDQLPPQAVRVAIEKHPPLSRVLHAAGSVAARFVGIPTEALGSALGPGTERRVQLAARLANPSVRGTQQQRAADAWLVDWLLTPPGGHRASLRRQLGLATQTPARPRPASLKRAGVLSSRYLMSLARLTAQHQVVI